MFDGCLTLEHPFGILRPMGRTRVRVGRLVSGASILVIGVALLAGRAGAGTRREARPPARIYVVRSGDTVWTLARRIVGEAGDPRPVVDRMVQANDLRDAVIVPGQRLRIP